MVSFAHINRIPNTLAYWDSNSFITSCLCLSIDLISCSWSRLSLFLLQRDTEGNTWILLCIFSFHKEERCKRTGWCCWFTVVALISKEALLSTPHSVIVLFISSWWVVSLWMSLRGQWLNGAQWLVNPGHAACVWEEKRPWQQSNVNVFKVFSRDVYFIHSVSPQSTKGLPDSFSFPNVQKKPNIKRNLKCVFSLLFSGVNKNMKDLKLQPQAVESRL